MRDLADKESHFLEPWSEFLVQGIPEIMRLILDDTKKKEDLVAWFDYKRNTRSIDHLFLPKPEQVSGIVNQVLFSRSADGQMEDFVIPDFAVYENSQGRVQVISTIPSYIAVSSSDLSSPSSFISSPFVPHVQPSFSSLSSSLGIGSSFHQTLVYASSPGESYSSPMAQSHSYAYQVSYSEEALSYTEVPLHQSSSSYRLSSEFTLLRQPVTQVAYPKVDHVQVDGTSAISVQPISLTYVHSPVVSEQKSGMVSTLETLHVTLDISNAVVSQLIVPPMYQVLQASKSVDSLSISPLPYKSLEGSQVTYTPPPMQASKNNLAPELNSQVHEPQQIASPVINTIQYNSEQVVSTAPTTLAVSVQPVQEPTLVSFVLPSYSTSSRDDLIISSPTSSFIPRATYVTLDAVVNLESQAAVVKPLVLSLPISTVDSRSKLSLTSVVRDGKILSGIQALFENYIVVESDLQNAAKMYTLEAVNVDTQQKQHYQVAENSLFGLVDKYLQALGAKNISYEVHTFTIQGKKLQKVLLKDVNGILGKEYDELKRGFAIFVNGQEPGNGTLNLEDYVVKAGDQVSLAVIDQDTYRGNFNGEKDLVTRCLASTELVNAAIAHEGLQDHFGLHKVHKDGKTLEGILTMIDNYSVKKSDLPTNSSYSITAVVDQKTGAKKYVEIASNSALAVIDKLLGQLGANPQYKMTTFAAGGKIHQYIELRGIFEYDKEALSHFGVDTNAYVGMLGFVNGEEPELGTKPLHEITVFEGDTLSLAYVHQGVYNGGYGKPTSSSVCLGTTVATRAAQLGLQSVFAEQDALVSGKRALGVVNHYVVQEQDIVSPQKEYAVNVIVNDKTQQVNVANNSVLAVVDQMLYKNKIGLNVDAQFNAAGEVYVRGVFERDQTAQQKLGNYNVKAVVDGKVVDDLVATRVKVGQDVSLVYVKK